MRNFGRVALAHHWLVGMRGGEKVLEQFGLLFPEAPIYTLVADPARLSPPLRTHAIHTSLLQRLPGGRRHYKKLLPLFPIAIDMLRIKAPVDLVVSSDAALIKGLSFPAGAKHVCYCHSPPRYLWDLQEDYRQSAEVGGALGRFVFNRFTPYTRSFDRRAAARVTHFVANSEFVRQRIKSCYGRDSVVIHPPVALDDFTPALDAPEDFFLVVSQLTPYKRIDLAVQAFKHLDRRLVVIGEGSERAKLEAMAGPHTTFLGSQPFEVLRDHYRRCRALVFPGIEDFGITPLEAAASGRPVIAFRAGGVLETVLERQTGIFFDQQTPASLAEAVELFDSLRFDVDVCRTQAERFAPERFRAAFLDYLDQALR